MEVIILTKDIWQIICKHAEWPELYVLTQVCVKSRIMAQKELDTTRWPLFSNYMSIFKSQCCYNGGKTSFKHTKDTVSVPKYIKWGDYRWVLCAFHKLFNNWTIEEVEEYLCKFKGLRQHHERFIRFARYGRGENARSLFCKKKKIESNT